MKNQNILCCINDAPLFSYSPILNKNFSKLDQIIINYVTEKTNCKRWIKKEKAKLENKLKRKYSDTTLIYQVKNRLLQKGFTLEEIKEVYKEK